MGVGATGVVGVGAAGVVGAGGGAAGVEAVAGAPGVVEVEAPVSPAPPVVDVVLGTGVVVVIDVVSGATDSEPLTECGPKYGLPVHGSVGGVKPLQ